MLLLFTDAVTGHTIAVNPAHVVVVFTNKNEEGVESTVINTLTGNVLAKESYVEVVGQLQGAK
jgi:hypothetical protein